MKIRGDLALRLIRRVDRVVAVASRALVLLSIAILLSITLLLFVNVLLRFVGGNVRGIVELVSYGLLACIMLALPYTHRSASHIRVTLVVDRFKPRTAKAFYVGAQLVTATVAFAIAAMYLANTFVDERFVADGLLPIPALPFRVAVVVGFGLWGIEALVALSKRGTKGDVRRPIANSRGATQ